MSNSNPQADKDSDLQQAANQVKPDEVKENLKPSEQKEQPEQLTEQEQTPFIEDDLRTDK
ncbi:hypothetical protein DLE54_07790 [Psychrobacter sp. YP14]|uniref:Uncharacterized protein n=3 Tax=Psychrobacter TaxID=497 RepID=A0A844LZR5_9GAMM|nr:MULTISPECIES: hypothetical protein [Psychrobacter]AWT49417.1 hypothetical protein DLE54_07790 [Psychrobacter sp. YP14]MUG32209.1 hypothetical protein [Psychrobacter sanguinis]